MSAMAGPPLRVWMLTDGRSGHQAQSEGVIAALATRYRPQVIRLPLRLRLGLCRRGLRALLNATRRPLPRAGLRLCVQLHLPSQGRPDLILSTGGRTAAANAWLARSFACPNVLVGHPRGLAARQFRAVLTLLPHADYPNNWVLELAPTRLDLRAAQEAAARLTPAPGSPGERLWLLGLGGTGAGYGYGPVDWEALARGLESLAGRHGIRWLVTSSPRTGRAAEAELRSALAKPWLAESSWFRPGQASRWPAYLGLAERVFCTEDSMTMLNEAMAARGLVYSLRPRRAAPATRYEQILQKFETAGRLLRLSLDQWADTDPALLGRTAPAWQANPREALANRLRALLGGIDGD
jgi:mitochondrial fission protein ELM1